MKSSGHLPDSTFDGLMNGKIDEQIDRKIDECLLAFFEIERPALADEQQREVVQEPQPVSHTSNHH